METIQGHNPDTNATQPNPQLPRVTLIASRHHDMEMLRQTITARGYPTTFMGNSNKTLTQLSNTDILVIDISVAHQPKSSNFIKVPAILILADDLETTLPPWLQAPHIFLRQYPQDPDQFIHLLTTLLPQRLPNFNIGPHKPEHLALLFGITQFLSGYLDIDDLFDRILELPPYLNAQFAALLVQESTETIYYRSTQPGREELTQAAGRRFARRLIDNGIEGWVLRHKQVVIIPNTLKDSRWLRASYLPDEEQCVVVLPIRLKKIEATGVYLLGHKQPNFFTDKALSLLEAATTQIEMAIENAILFKNQSQRSVQLALINEVSHAATSILNLDVMLRTVVQAIRRSFAFYNVAIYLYNPATNLVELHAQSRSNPFDTPAAKEANTPRAFKPRQGLVGWAAAKKETVLANDVTLDPRYILTRTNKKIRSKLCVPIAMGVKTIGVLDLQSTQLEAFDKYHVSALKTLAGQLSIAIENARLYEEINRHIQELKSLNEIGQAITSTFLDFRKTLTLVTDHTTQLMNVAAASVVLRDDKRGDTWFAAASGEGSEAVIGKRMKKGQGIAGWVTEQGEPVIVPDVSTDHRFFANMDKQSGFITKSILCVPLQTKGYTIGAIEVMNKSKGTFNEDDLALLQALATPAATAIENAQLFEQAETLRIFNEDLIQNMTNGLIAIDKNCRITAINPAASKMLGYQTDQVLHQPLANTIGHAENLIEMFNITLSTGKACPRKEITVQHNNGHMLPISVSTALLGQEDGKDTTIGVVGVIEDLSEIKALEAEHRQLDRLAALGEMSAVVAHEIRNPVAGIAAGVDYLTRNAPKGSAEAQGAAMIQGEVNRVNHILEDILFVARPLKLNPAYHWLRPIIDVVLQRCRPLIEANHITVTTRFNDNLPQLYVDDRRMEQVLTNLVINATQAMLNGGRLTIQADYLPPNAETLQVVSIKIIDTGAGIPADVQKRIFDPFFTTKAKGTGLGLSVAYRITEAHHGTIHLKSTPETGTCFTIRLPVEKRDTP